MESQESYQQQKQPEKELNLGRWGRWWTIIKELHPCHKSLKKRGERKSGQEKV